MLLQVHCTPKIRSLAFELSAGDRDRIATGTVVENVEFVETP